MKMRIDLGNGWHSYDVSDANFLLILALLGGKNDNWRLLGAPALPKPAPDVVLTPPRVGPRSAPKVTPVNFTGSYTHGAPADDESKVVPVATSPATSKRTTFDSSGSSGCTFGAPDDDL
jgi:hypothetical protein